MTAAFVFEELKSMANPEKVAYLQRFFKTGPGEYAEGDLFLGLMNPQTRSIAKANKSLPISELQILLENRYHEARLCALVIATERYKRAKPVEKKELYDFFIKNTRYINNWDLIDDTCPHVIGEYLLDKDRSILYKFAKSKNLWEQRIAIISSRTFVRNGDFKDTIVLAEMLIDHKHDLMHKAVGWMLREIGKRDKETLSEFLEKYATKMPRTALRYAIEHYPEPERQYFLKKK